MQQNGAYCVRIPRLCCSLDRLTPGSRSWLQRWYVVSESTGVRGLDRSIYISRHIRDVEATARIVKMRCKRGGVEWLGGQREELDKGLGEKFHPGPTSSRDWSHAKTTDLNPLHPLPPPYPTALSLCCADHNESLHPYNLLSLFDCKRGIWVPPAHLHP